MPWDVSPDYGGPELKPWLWGVGVFSFAAGFYQLL
jgi:hypothetical protein